MHLFYTLSSPCLHIVYALSTPRLHLAYTLSSPCLHLVYTLSTPCLHLVYSSFQCVLRRFPGVWQRIDAICCESQRFAMICSDWQRFCGCPGFSHRVLFHQNDGSRGGDETAAIRLGGPQNGQHTAIGLMRQVLYDCELQHATIGLLEADSTRETRNTRRRV